MVIIVWQRARRPALHVVQPTGFPPTQTRNVGFEESRGS